MRLFEGIQTEERASTAHIDVSILPPELHARQKISPSMEQEFIKTHLKGLDYRVINVTKQIGDEKILILDLDPLQKSLEDIEGSHKTLLNLSIPSPRGSRYKDGSTMLHANTVLIDPQKREIRVNEPMSGVLVKPGSVERIEFSLEIKKAFQEKYPGYAFIDEKWAVQVGGETICLYIALKVAQSYHTGNPKEISRKVIFEEWKKDVKLFLPSENFSSSVHNLYELVEPIASEMVDQCTLYIKSALKSQFGMEFSANIIRPLKYSFLSWVCKALGYEYKKNDEIFNFEENRSFDVAIRYFSECYLFHCGNILIDGGIFFNAQGSALIEKLLPAYQHYFDAMIAQASFASAMSKEEAEQKFDALLRANPLIHFNPEKNEYSKRSEHSETRDEVIGIIQQCLLQAFPTLG